MKFNTNNNVSTFKEYKLENLINSQISIPLNIIDEFIEAQNLRDKSSNAHIKTLNKFYNI